jgi:hypothetical protein
MQIADAMKRGILTKAYELRHDKTKIMGLPPAWIQTSLSIHTV